MESRFVREDEKTKAIVINFEGDFIDNVYKEVWYRALLVAKEKGVKRFIINQEDVGNVSFSSRSWFMIEMIPLIKKELQNELEAFILPSKKQKHLTSLKLMMSTVALLTNFKFTVVKSMEEIEKLIN